METTERIVESYCRYVKGWFTIPNIKCPAQYEIDLLAVDPSSDIRVERYHIECGVSISGAYSRLTARDFSQERLKKRVEQAGQRRTIDYFIQRKFGPKEVVSKLEEYGFSRGNYTKVIVTWGWTTEAKEVAERAGIILWDFPEILTGIAKSCRGKKTYFADDTLRTIQLFLRSTDKKHATTPSNSAFPVRLAHTNIFGTSQTRETLHASASRGEQVESIAKVLCNKIIGPAREEGQTEIIVRADSVAEYVPEGISKNIPNICNAMGFNPTGQRRIESLCNVKIVARDGVKGPKFKVTYEL